MGSNRDRSSPTRHFSRKRARSESRVCFILFLSRARQSPRLKPYCRQGTWARLVAVAGAGARAVTDGDTLSTLTRAASNDIFADRSIRGILDEGQNSKLINEADRSASGSLTVDQTADNTPLEQVVEEAISLVLVGWVAARDVANIALALSLGLNGLGVRDSASRDAGGDREGEGKNVGESELHFGLMIQGWDSKEDCEEGLM